MYQLSIEYLKRLQRKIQKCQFKERALTPVKVGQAYQPQTWSVLCRDKFIYKFEVNISKDKREKFGNLNFSKGQ